MRLLSKRNMTADRTCKGTHLILHMRRVVCPLKLSQNVTLVLPTPFLSLLVRKMATVVYAQYGHPGSDEEGVIFEFNENDTHQTDSEDELTLVRGPASKHKRRASPRAPALPAAATGGRRRPWWSQAAFKEGAGMDSHCRD